MQRKSERHAPPVTQAVPAVTNDEAVRRESAAAGAEPAATAATIPSPGIVKTKQFIIKPMSAEEAAMQMELVGHDFFVFRNAETNDTNVVYRRRDGQYGVIEPAARLAGAPHGAPKSDEQAEAGRPTGARPRRGP